MNFGHHANADRQLDVQVAAEPGIGQTVAIDANGGTIEGVVTEIIPAEIHDIATYIVQSGTDTYLVYADELLILTAA